LRGRVGYAPATRVDLFVGESDDWTSPKPCIALGQAMEAMNMPVLVTTYPGTYHGFDAPNMTRPLHLDVPTGVRPGQGVTVAPNRDARNDAYAKVMARLRAAFQN
jgi:dienelactone hydrolase